MSQDDSWLQRYLEESVRRKLCTKIHCTTCGAMEFRKGLWEQLSSATGLELGPMFGGASGMAHALVRVQQGEAAAREFEKAVRLILFEIWPFLGGEGDSELAVILRGSWAGSVLARMLEHAAAREAARRSHAEFEAGAEKRREEKKRLKQEQHAARLTAKAERDRLWREKQNGRGK